MALSIGSMSLQVCYCKVFLQIAIFQSSHKNFPTLGSRSEKWYTACYHYSSCPIVNTCIASNECYALKEWCSHARLTATDYKLYKTGVCAV